MSPRYCRVNRGTVLSPNVLSFHKNYCRVTRGFVMVVASVAVGEGLCAPGGGGGG